MASSAGFVVDPKRVAVGCGMAVALLGVVILGAWLAGNEPLKQVHPDWPTMKANTALGFVSLGASLALLATGRTRAGQAVALVAFLIGTLTLVQYVAGVDLGIDQLLFKDTGSASGTTSPGRPAIPTAATFILQALVLLSWPVPTRSAHVATALAGFVSLLNLAFYFLGAIPPITGTRMAVHTASAFLLVCAGVLAARSRALADLLLGRRLGSRLARLLLLPTFALPLLTGWLAARAVDDGHLTPDQGAAFALFTDLAILSALVGFALLRLQGETMRSDRLQADLQRSLQRVDDAERVTGRGSWEWSVSDDRAVWSGGMYRLFGVDPATFVNSNDNFLALVHPDDRARMGQAIADALAKPGRFLQDYRLTRPDGQLRYLRGEGSVVTDPGGKPTVLYGVVVDVTSVRELEEAARKAGEGLKASEAKLRTIFEHSPVGILLTRGDGTVVDLNPAAEQLWGRTRAQFLDPAFRTAELFVDPAQRAPLVEGLKARGFHRDLELDMRRGDGAQRRMSFNVATIRLGDETVFLSTGIDITPLREAEGQLRTKNAALTASESRFRLLFDSNPVAVVISKADGTGLVDVNQAYEKLVGYRRDELLSPRFDITKLSASPERREALIKSLRDSGGADALEIDIRHRDGRLRNIVASVRTFQFEGQPCFLTAAQDITETKEMQLSAARAQERFVSVFRASPVAIALTKEDGRFIDVNEAYCTLVGRTRAVLLDGKLRAVDVYEDPQQRHRMLNAIRQRGLVHEFELNIKRPDGEVRAALASVEFIDLGGDTTILSLLQDITDRNRAQADREARIATEAELERLRRTDKFRTEFINSTAHELATPLTPLVLHVKALAVDKTLTQAQHKVVDALQRNVTRLRNLVDDMVGAADLQARTMALDRRRLNLTRELKAAVAAHLAAAERAGIELREPEDGGFTVSADPARLQLVLGHLLGNAIKFTPANGKVWLATRKVGDQVRVSVNDTGIGLSHKQMEGLWKPFSQAHDKSQRTDSGSGLGLYVTRGIVELHGGEVGCSSDGAGKGASFWFTLPLATGHVDPLAKPRPDEPTGPPPRRNLNPSVRDDDA